MDKYSKITVIAIIAIIIPFTYSALNIYAAEQLQFRWNEQGKFNFFALSNSGDVEFCNKLPYPTNFKKFEIIPYYDLKNKGVFTIESFSIDPSTRNVQSGVFYSEGFTEAQHLFMQLDFEFGGGPIRIDPNKMYVLVNIHTPIIGIIPYYTTIQYSGYDFSNLMNKNFDC